MVKRQHVASKKDLHLLPSFGNFLVMRLAILFRIFTRSVLKEVDIETSDKPEHIVAQPKTCLHDRQKCIMHFTLGAREQSMIRPMIVA